jgi:hypothetical protein
LNSISSSAELGQKVDYLQGLTQAIQETGRVFRMLQVDMTNALRNAEKGLSIMACHMDKLRRTGKTQPARLNQQGSNDHENSAALDERPPISPPDQYGETAFASPYENDLQSQDTQWDLTI